MTIKEKNQLIEKVEHIGFLYSKQASLILELVGSMRKHKKEKTLKQWQEEVREVFNLSGVEGTEIKIRKLNKEKDLKKLEGGKKR